MNSKNSIQLCSKPVVSTKDALVSPPLHSSSSSCPIFVAAHNVLRALRSWLISVHSMIVFFVHSVMLSAHLPRFLCPGNSVDIFPALDMWPKYCSLRFGSNQLLVLSYLLHDRSIRSMFSQVDPQEAYIAEQFEGLYSLDVCFLQRSRTCVCDRESLEFLSCFSD